MDERISSCFRLTNRTFPPYIGEEVTTRQTIYDLFRDEGYRKGVEVGVMAGCNAKMMFRTIPDLDLTLVDPWKQFSKHTPDKWMQGQYERCMRRLRHWNPTYMRMDSMEAAEKIEDGSLDFVYIDGGHDFDNVMLDLIHWSKKVRTGGVVSGHDFFYGDGIDVVPAVVAYTQAHNIHRWYITGGVRPYSNTNEPPSWLWVKK